MPAILAALMGLKLPAWAGKAALIAAAVLAILFAVHTWDNAIRHGAVAKVEAKSERAARVTEAKVAKITTANAITEAAAQAVEKEKTRVIVQKVPAIVERVVRSPCVPWGLVRLHDAAASGVDPADHPAPAGEPDDACAPITPGAFAAVIADNYGTARANAEQLNALEADIKQRIDAANGTEDKTHAPR